MKTVTFKTSLSAITLALMCNLELCPITRDAFSCPLEGTVDCEDVTAEDWDAIMEDADERDRDRA